MIAIEQRPVSEIVGDVFEGLTKTPKSLPPRLFYDAAGSALFAMLAWVLPAEKVPRYYIAFAVALVLPMARLAAAPLVLAWNRHR